MKFIFKKLPFILYKSIFKTKTTLIFQYRDDFNYSSKRAPIWSSTKSTSNRRLNMTVHARENFGLLVMKT